MRNLFLLLVLVNLGVLAWFSWIDVEPAPPPPYDGPGITLLRETERGPEPGAAAPAETPPVFELPPAEVVTSDEQTDVADVGLAEDELIAEAPVVSAGPARCLSIGPFRDESEADTALETLVAAGFDPTRAIRQAEVWEGYWVFIERLDSQAAAREIAADLAENGLTDTQVIPNSDSGTLLSLGVFSEIARAASQASRVNELGYEATIADSMRSAETHWLDVTLTQEESIALELLQTPGTISRLEQRACSEE